MPVPAALPKPPSALPTAVPTPGRNVLSAMPATIGRIDDRKPASGRPVSGLTVSDPPCARATVWRAFTSLGAMWTSVESGPRPRAARCWAASCRLIGASRKKGYGIVPWGFKLANFPVGPVRVDGSKNSPAASNSGTKNGGQGIRHKSSGTGTRCGRAW